MRRNLLKEFLAGSLAYCQNDVCAVRCCQPASHSQAKLDFLFLYFCKLQPLWEKRIQREHYAIHIRFLCHIRFFIFYVFIKWVAA